MSLYLCLSLCVCVSLSPFVCLSLSLFQVSACLSLCLSVSVSVSALSVSICLCPYLFLWLSLSVSKSFCLYLCLSLSLSVCLCLSASGSLPLSLSISKGLLSLSISKGLLQLICQSTYMHQWMQSAPNHCIVNIVRKSQVPRFYPYPNIRQHQINEFHSLKTNRSKRFQKQEWQSKPKCASHTSKHSKPGQFNCIIAANSKQQSENISFRLPSFLLLKVKLEFVIKCKSASAEALADISG